MSLSLLKTLLTVGSTLGLMLFYGADEGFGLHSPWGGIAPLITVGGVGFVAGVIHGRPLDTGFRAATTATITTLSFAALATGAYFTEALASSGQAAALGIAPSAIWNGWGLATTELFHVYGAPVTPVHLASGALATVIAGKTVPKMRGSLDFVKAQPA